MRVRQLIKQLECVLDDEGNLEIGSLVGSVVPVEIMLEIDKHPTERRSNILLLNLISNADLIKDN